MPIDSREEQCYTLAHIRQYLPATTRGGKPPHPSVIYRWVTRGIKAKDGTVCRLDCLVCGGAICTSREAVERFFGELTARSGLPVARPAVASARERERTSRELVALGLK
jgi:Protein of unknown function (DUF1580)